MRCLLPTSLVPLVTAIAAAPDATVTDAVVVAVAAAEMLPAQAPECAHAAAAAVALH